MSDSYAPQADAEKALTDWKSPPTLANLKQDLQDADQYHKAQVAKIDGWLDNLNVTGTAKVDTPKGTSKIVPKLIRKQAEWRYAALSEPFLSTDDVFNVSPVSFEDKAAAVQNEMVLNHQFNTKINKVGFIDEYVRTAVDEGTVIVRLGWAFEEEEFEVEVPDVTFHPNPSLGPMHQQLHQLMQEDPERYAAEVPQEIQAAHEQTMQTGMPTEAIVTGSRTEKQTRTVKNHPTLEICNYHNVIIDPTCKGDLAIANFIVYSFESSKALLAKDGRYKNLDRINADSLSILGDPDHVVPNLSARSFEFTDKARKKFVVREYWGYWDIDDTGIVSPFVAAWVGNTLIRMERNPFPDQKLPFVSTQYLPVRKDTYGEPDGALLEDNQKIIGAVTRGMIDIMGKSANGQTGFRKDMLDVTNKRKFERGQDYEFNANVDPRQGVFMHVYPEIPQSAQFMLNLQNMEAESLTGVKAFNNGISSQSLGDVAAGIRGALDASSKRELGILRRLSAGITEIGRKIIAMNGEFLSDVEVVRVTNEEFVEVRRDDLMGNFDLKLSISTAEEDNNKAQELAFMLQTMGNNMDPEMSRMILADIAKLRKMPDLAKRIKDYQPQADPMAEKQKELQLAMLEAEVRKLNAEAMGIEAKAQLDLSRVGTEQARQQDLVNSADQKNLDFVEQESGVKQERDLQKQGAQARAQGGLAVLQHELDKRFESSKPKKT